MHRKLNNGIVHYVRDAREVTYCGLNPDVLNGEPGVPELCDGCHERYNRELFEELEDTIDDLISFAKHAKEKLMEYIEK